MTSTAIGLGVAGKRLTILGAGNTGFSLAANLALAGHDVLIWEHPNFVSAIEPIRSTLTIHLDGFARNGAARLAGVTTDPAEALAWSDTLICSVPSYAHAPFIAELGTHLTPRHTVMLFPGNLGSLAFAKALRDAGAAGATIVESDTAPYVCRKTAPDRAVIWGVVPHLGVGVFPSAQTSEVLPDIQALFPGAAPYQHVLEAGLSAMNPVVHPAGVLLNAGRIERSRGEFYFYEEGVTPAVVRAIEAVDRERLAIGAAYGLSLTPVAEAFHAAGFGPAGDVWATINGSRMLTALRAPGQIDTRWLSEDVPYGIATWAALGRAKSIATPVLDGLIALASVVLARDFAASHRSLAELGIDGLSDQQLASLLANGA